MDRIDRRLPSRSRRPRGEVSHYALYGEHSHDVSPEFVHSERIVDRSSRHDWTIEPHAHPGLWQVLLIEEGTALLASERGQREVTGPGAFVVPSGAVHAFRFSPHAQGWVLSFAAALLNDPRLVAFVGALDLASEGARWRPLGDAPVALERLGWAMADIDRALGAGEGFTAATLASLTVVLAAVAGIQDLEARRPHPRATLAERFAALVEVHYRQHWSVTDYAGVLGTTAATLTRACREAFGKAPAGLVHDRLLLEARRYLAFTAAPVGTIADRLGFADPAYFARFFKSGTGMTATQWRERETWDAAIGKQGEDQSDDQSGIQGRE